MRCTEWQPNEDPASDADPASFNLLVHHEQEECNEKRVPDQGDAPASTMAMRLLCSAFCWREGAPPVGPTPLHVGDHYQPGVADGGIEQGTAEGAGDCVQAGSCRSLLPWLAIGLPAAVLLLGSWLPQR